MPAIEVSHLTKEYRLGALQGLKQTVLNTGARLVGRKVPERPMFRALNDVNFNIEPGEVVGIIGHNGAGKSTLLKMLARISLPTSGTVKVNGRIAPLIEVGAGFVPDFTGRENVYLNAAILGMSKTEIDKKFEEIVDFAEMAEFIDTPVKRYSSGMHVKLAFAVATSVESEILIVDEVLAVGDMAFQRKCFDRMEDLIKRENRTVLIVSHNVRQIERLCSRVILLDHGRMIADGDPTNICNQFFEISNAKIRLDSERRTVRNLRETPDIRFRTIETCDANGRVADRVECLEPVTFRCHFEVMEPLKRICFLVGVHTTDFFYLTANNTVEREVDFEPGLKTIELRLGSLSILPGVYCLRVWIGTPEGRESFYGEGLGTFEVFSNDHLLTRQQQMGLVHLEGSWKVRGATDSNPSVLNIRSNHQQIELFSK
jgi:lipopolysaccharide transport system ATP-binding protein